MSFAKTKYPALYFLQVFKQLWLTCLFNVMKWGGAMGVEGKKKQETAIFSSCMNCNCCSRKELETGNPRVSPYS